MLAFTRELIQREGLTLLDKPRRKTLITSMVGGDIGGRNY